MGTVTLARARTLAAFRIGVPAALGPPDRVEIADPATNGAPRVVSLNYDRAAIRIDEFDGTLDGPFVKAAQDVRYVTVGGQSALWFATPHPLRYRDRTGVTRTDTGRMAGPTLVWVFDQVTYRLEGVGSANDAVAVAESMR